MITTAVYCDMCGKHQPHLEKQTVEIPKMVIELTVHRTGQSAEVPIKIQLQDPIENARFTFCQSCIKGAICKAVIHWDNTLRDLK